MRTWARLVVFVAALGLAAGASAEPRFAVKEGMRCAHCHINKTGGGMRTPFGVTFAQTSLPTWRLPAPFDPMLGEHVAIGANLRLDYLTVLPAETDLEGQTRSTEATSSFEMPEANLYLRADIVPDILTVYIDETIGPEGAAAREAFVMVQPVPGKLWVKGGRLLLPFGLRIPDDNAFIRQETGFTYSNQDLGLEIGLDLHPVTLAVTVSNGSLGGADPDLFKQVTFHAEAAWSWGRAGASFAFNDSSTDDFGQMTFTTGAHLGLRLGRLVALAEFDWLRGVGDSETYDQWMLYVAADYEAFKGLFVRFAFEANDPLMEMANNERDRFSFGVSWFPIQMMELRLEYRLNRDIPQRVQENADEVLFQLHGFL